MEKYPMDVPCKGNREPIASEIASLAAILAGRAEETAGRVADKLVPICSPEHPQPPLVGLNKADIIREYPPLFEDLRDKLLCIERAFNRINNVLDRAEV